MQVKKEKLLSFIKKYSLGKENDSVRFKFDPENKNVEVRFITDDRTMVGEIYMGGIPCEELLEFGIMDTDRLKKMVGVLNDDISISVEKNNGGEITSAIFSDGTSEVSYMTAKLHVIPRVPALKSIPDADYGIEIDENLAYAIRSGVSSIFSAQDKTQSFTISQKKDKVYLLINHIANANSNKIKYEVKKTADSKEITKDISFTVKFLNQALLANMEYFSEKDKKLKLMVSERGIATLFIETPEFLSKYYLTEVSSK